MTDDELDQRIREAVLAEPVDVAPLERSIRARIQVPRIPRWAFVAAAGIALIVAGGWTYRSFFKPQPPPVCVAAAQDHRREIVNGQPRRWLSDVSAIQSLAEKQDVPASAIAALATTGYRLERGRLCLLKKQIFLHLVYSKDGAEYSVYLRPRGAESVGDSVRETEVGPEELAYFQSDRLTAVFVAHQSGANVLAFARAGLHSLTVVAL
jgi:anti-sigma factor RsiW